MPHLRVPGLMKEMGGFSHVPGALSLWGGVGIIHLGGALLRGIQGIWAREDHTLVPGVGVMCQ